jgi:hypothetical protein
MTCGWRGNNIAESRPITGALSRHEPNVVADDAGEGNEFLLNNPRLLKNNIRLEYQIYKYVV